MHSGCINLFSSFAGLFVANARKIRTYFTFTAVFSSIPKSNTMLRHSTNYTTRSIPLSFKISHFGTKIAAYKMSTPHLCVALKQAKQQRTVTVAAFSIQMTEYKYQKSMYTQLNEDSKKQKKNNRILRYVPRLERTTGGGKKRKK